MVIKMRAFSRFKNGQVQILFSLLLIMLVLIAPAKAEIAPAGVTITNRAEISWFDTKDGLVKRLLSNISEIVVAEQYGLLLEDDNHRYASPGQTVALPHRVKNIGNVASSYQLQVSQHQNDSGDLSSLSVFEDTNGNGIVDLGETKLSSVA
jgi:hypothetical protein